MDDEQCHGLLIVSWKHTLTLRRGRLVSINVIRWWMMVSSHGWIDVSLNHLQFCISRIILESTHRICYWIHHVHNCNIEESFHEYLLVLFIADYEDYRVHYGKARHWGLRYELTVWNRFFFINFINKCWRYCSYTENPPDCSRQTWTKWEKIPEGGKSRTEMDLFNQIVKIQYLQKNCEGVFRFCCVSHLSLWTESCWPITESTWLYFSQMLTF